jgi:hypothetical protein
MIAGFVCQEKAKTRAPHGHSNGPWPGCPAHVCRVQPCHAAIARMLVNRDDHAALPRLSAANM